MDKSQVKGYEAPEVKVIDVVVEQGFAASEGFGLGGSSVSGWEDGGSFDDSFLM